MSLRSGRIKSPQCGGGGARSESRAGASRAVHRPGPDPRLPLRTDTPPPDTGSCQCARRTRRRGARPGPAEGPGKKRERGTAGGICDSRVIGQPARPAGEARGGRAPTQDSELGTSVVSCRSPQAPWAHEATSGASAPYPPRFVTCEMPAAGVAPTEPLAIAHRHTGRAAGGIFVWCRFFSPVRMRRPLRCSAAARREMPAGGSSC